MKRPIIIFFSLLILVSFGIARLIGAAIPRHHGWGVRGKETSFGTFKGEWIGYHLVRWNPRATAAGHQSNSINGVIEQRYVREGHLVSNFVARYKVGKLTREAIESFTNQAELRCFFSLSNGIEFNEVHETVIRETR